MGLITNIIHVTKETGPKIGCFAGFCSHHLATTSMHTHVCIAILCLKVNKNRFVNNHCMYKRYSTIT